jgi:outer membrane protein assembly factor BamB
MQRLTGSPNETDNCSYGSPILVDWHGRRMIVNSSLRHVFGVNADTGQLLWTRPLPTRYSVIAATPVLVGDSVFITAPDTDEGGKLFRVWWEPPTVSVETVWTTPFDTCHGGQVLVDGTLYGSWYRRGKGWAAVDVKTGVIRCQLRDLAQGSVLYADGRLYCLSQEGEMALIKPAADHLEVTGRFRLVPERKSDVWTHPVILDGRLYLRYQDRLSCYDVRNVARSEKQ